MRPQTNFLLLIFFSLSISLSAQEQSNAIQASELELLLGEWEGSLRYLDYTSGEPYQMPCNLRIERSKKMNHFTMYQEYPNEPKANNSTKLKISEDGMVINGHSIITRIVHPDGDVEYQMEYEGKDDNKKAIIRQTFIIGPDVFVRQKEVKYNPNESWILRNTFSYVKKK